MKKNNQIKKTIRMIDINISLGLIVAISILLVILYNTIDRLLISRVYFGLLFAFAFPFVFLIIDWHVFKKSVYKKFYKNPNFVIENPKYRELIDKYYNNVLYEIDALFGAYLRKNLRIAFITFWPLLFCLITSVTII